MKYITVAGACLNQTPLDWGGNRQRLIQAVRMARKQGVAILCLPELSISGYGCEDSFFSGYMLQESLHSLSALAQECEDLTVSVGLPLEFENCLYNVSCVIQNQRILGFVAKQELAGDGVHYEPRWFKRWPKDLVMTYKWNGNEFPLGDLIFEIDGVRIGFEICEDAWNGVRPAQDHYLHNVDLILNPSASHFAFGKTLVREKLVTEASRGFSCAYLYSNLLGNEAGRIIYDGEILIAQGGNLVARNERFSFQEVQLVSAVLDMEAIRRQKKKSFNFAPSLPVSAVQGVAPLPEAADPDFFRDVPKLPPAMSKEEEFYRAVTLGLFDYMRKSRSRGFVISLSGGADSSACAVLSAHALTRARQELGPEEFNKRIAYAGAVQEDTLIPTWVTCVYQGTENSGGATLESAKELAASLGAAFHVWNVQPLFDEYEKLAAAYLGSEMNWKQHDIPLQNIQARLRSPGIWAVANLQNGLLLTTSNRSEAAVGYATMDGDTSGGLAPLSGIDKAFLLKWLRWAETELKLPGLKFVNNLQPTAELRPPGEMQTDEKDLMPYAILDHIEKCAIRDYKSPVEVFKTLRGIAEDANLKLYIRRFFTLWCRNQWKRERYAPGFHLDDENLDPRTWCRFPILSGGFVEALAQLDQYV